MGGKAHSGGLGGCLCQDAGKDIRVYIAAAEDDADPFAAHLIALLHESRKGGGTGTFCDIVRGLKEGAHGGGDFLLIYRDDAVYTLQHGSEAVFIGAATGHAVGQHGGDGVLNPAAGGE